VDGERTLFAGGERFVAVGGFGRAPEVACVRCSGGGVQREGLGEFFGEY